MNLKRFKFLSLLLIVLGLLAVIIPASAQSAVPAISVSDQMSLDGCVVINSVYSEAQGFVVIHKDDGSGAPGPVIGYRAVEPGWTYNLCVFIDVAQATPTLFAMLHADDNQIGVYEFGTVQGADAPISVNGQVVTPSFKVTAIRVYDQFVSNNTVTIAAAVMQVPGFMVVHSGDPGSFGGVLGYAAIPAGTSANIVVNLDPNGQTEVMWPMLHVDDNTVGQYEFGTVQGADNPVVYAGKIATTPFWTAPHIRVADQSVLPPVAPETGPVLKVASVLAQVAGFLVVHQESNGSYGPVAGLLPVPAGLSTNLTVPLDPNIVTPALWPMLHVDDNTIGQYEFGTVQGADGPVLVDGQVLTFRVVASPALVMDDQTPITGEAASSENIVIREAIIDQRGFIAIHADANGNAGPVIAYQLIHPGLNRNVVISIPTDQAGSRVFPMLHYDTGQPDVYEFGTVQGADNPVSVAGAVVVAPLNLLAPGQTPPATQAAPPPPVSTPQVAPPAATQEVNANGPCSVVASLGNVNMRSGPDTNAPVAGTLAFGQTAAVDGQLTDSAGFVWYHLSTGADVRSDVVTTTGDCSNLPVLAAPPAPAGTQEVGS